MKVNWEHKYKKGIFGNYKVSDEKTIHARIYIDPLKKDIWNLIWRINDNHWSPSESFSNSDIAKDRFKEICINKEYEDEK